MTKITDYIPEIISRYGRVWVLTIPETLRMAQIKAWVASVPSAHPVWSMYYFSLIHLRPHEGSPDAVKYSPSATHELSVLAIKPNVPVMQGEVPSFLMPPNFIGQFAADSDTDAIEWVMRCLHEVCDGALSPDKDFRRDWIDRFPYTQNMLQTLGGVIPDTRGRVVVPRSLDEIINEADSVVVPSGMPFNVHSAPAVRADPLIVEALKVVRDHLYALEKVEPATAVVKTIHDRLDALEKWSRAKS